MERVEHCYELCIRAWVECKLGDIGTQPEHPLAQATRTASEAAGWIKAVLDAQVRE